MVAHQSLYRTVGLTVSVVILTLALLFAYPTSLKSTSTPAHHVVLRQQPIVESQSLEISISLPLRNIAVPFGHDNHQLNASLSPIPRALSKRDPALYARYVCIGGQLWERVQAAFDGQVPPGRVFSDGDANEPGGWKSLDDPANIPFNFRKTFDDEKFGGVPAREDVREITKSNVEAFTNDFGKQQPTGGAYEMLFIPSKQAVMAVDVESPKYKLMTRGTNPLRKEETRPFEPRLSRLSDMIWTVYNKLAGEANSGGLRYIMHNYVVNGDSESVMEYIVEKSGGNVDNLPWPGKTFGMDQDEGLALLGVPNGLATAYLMIDRAALLGRRNPKITIFKCGSAFCMLWDMVPGS
ncbi:MAG: hypothetical protein Q9220_006201 [cf. Caloplaca sp. 1 TL-2023]